MNVPPQPSKDALLLARAVINEHSWQLDKKRRELEQQFKQALGGRAVSAEEYVSAIRDLDAVSTWLAALAAQ